MKRTIYILRNLLFLFSLLYGVPGATDRTQSHPLDNPAYATSNEQTTPYVPGEVLVRFHPGVSLNAEVGKGILVADANLRGLLARVGVIDALSLPLISQRPGSLPLEAEVRQSNFGMDRVYRLHLDVAMEVLSAVNILSSSPYVEYAEPNYILRTAVTPDDPYFFQQWGLSQIGAEDAWDLEQGSLTMVISILDTGLDLDHPDLAERLWTNPGEIPGNGIDDDSNGYVDDISGWNFAEGNSNTQDDSGHGTHVAGIAAASGNNGIGVAGVDWNARIMPLRVLNAGGAGTHADVAAALVYASDKGASVANMSFGAYTDSQTLSDAVDYASQTTLLVGAAGNNGSEDLFYPAAYPQVLAVAATGPGDVKTAFSNYGAWVDLSAPGETIWSTVYDDAYIAWSGTSMAAPFVAGSASLVMAHYTDLSLGALRWHLLNTTADVDTPNPAYTGLLGVGRLDLYNALNTTPQSHIKVGGYSVDGVSEGSPEPGTTVSLTVTLDNTWADAYAVSGTLSTTDTWVSISNPTSSFGDILGGSSGTNTVPFTLILDVTAPFNEILPLDLAVEANGGAYSQTISLTLTTASSIQNVGSLTIDTDTTWTVDRQYVIGGQVQVLQGVTLTIEPGVVMQFEPTGSLAVSGTLIANGTQAAPIIFEDKGSGQWGGITFADDSVDATFNANGDYENGSIMRYVHELNATTGLNLETAAPYVAESTFSGNTTAIAVSGSDPCIEDNEITDNGTGIALSDGSRARIEGNIIEGNSTGISGVGVSPMILRNDIQDNETGLSLSTSGYNVVEGNLFTVNTTGASVAPGWPSNDRIDPDVAYNSARGEYLIVWEDARDVSSHRIYGQRVSGEGIITGGEITIAVAADSVSPCIAYDPVEDAYLVVWREPAESGYALQGQMLTSDGTLNSSLFNISNYTGTQNSYGLAANTTAGGYLFVWNDSTDGDYDVYAQLVSATGQLNGTRLSVISDDFNQMDVTTTYNPVTNEYFAVWAENLGALSGWDLTGRLVSADGTFPGIPLTVSAASGDQRGPAIAAETGLGWYTVVWHDTRNYASGDIYGRRLTSSGVLYGNDVEIVANATFEQQQNLTIEFNSAQYEQMIVWGGNGGGGIVANRLSASGALAAIGSIGISPNSLPNTYDRLPVIAYDSQRQEILTVWERQNQAAPSEPTRLFSQRLASDGTLLDNPSTSRDESDPSVNFPIVLGSDFTHNTVARNDTGLLVDAVDPDLMIAQANNLLRNTSYNVVNASSDTLGMTGNYWGTTDTGRIILTISGAATITPTLSVPDDTAPAILWRLFFSTDSNPTPQEAVEGVAYGPVGAEVLNIAMEFSKEMDTSQVPIVTIGTGSETDYIPTHLVRFGQWVNDTHWEGSYQVDWYTGDGIKRVSVQGARDTAQGFETPLDRRFTFEVSILAATSPNVQPGWGQVTLSWDPADLATVAGYHVYKADQSGGPYSRINPSLLLETTYTDTGVENNTTYYYKVNVVSTDLEERDYTEEAAVTPGDVTSPSTPVVTDDGTCTPYTNRLHASWLATDPESGIAEYHYSIGTTSGGQQIVSWTSAGTSTQITHTGLSLIEGMTYYFNVKAKNGAGAWSGVGSSDGIQVDSNCPFELYLPLVIRND